MRLERRVKAFSLYLLVVTMATFAIAEVSLRLLTETTTNGIQKIERVALLPLRPTEPYIRRALEDAKHDHLLVPDRDIGWSVRPNKTTDGDHTNAQGIRTDKDHLYALDPPETKVRIITLGDSYVYSMQVDNGETWQDYLGRIRGDVELLNFGIPGAGTDQAFLRWRRDGRPFKAKIVMLGIWPDNILRNLNMVGYYRSQLSLTGTKPRLILEGGGTPRFVNLPTMSDDELVATLTNPETNPLLQHEHWYNTSETTPRSYRSVRLVQFAESIWRRYQRRVDYQRIFSGENPEGNDVTAAIAKMFAHEVREAGAIPLIFIIPDRARLEMHVGGKPFPLVDRLRREGLEVIDLGPTFGAEVLKEGAERYYVDGVGHNSPFGNKVFATYLEKELRPWIDKVKGSAQSHSWGSPH